MRRSRFIVTFLLAFITMSVIGCTSKDRQDMYDKGSNYTIQDQSLGYNRDDYRNAMRARSAEKADSLDNIPQLAPVISEDKKNILPQPLVSITVNQDVPIRDIFYELAKQAQVDLELDPTITGSVIFTAYNRPFDQVVERIADMAGLRYKFKNNVLRVERDTPFMKTYHVDYISMQRKYTSSVKSNTSASGSSGGGGGGGSSGNNGADSTIDIASSMDFWSELSKNITQIIDSTNQQVVLTDQSAPISAPQAIPAVTPGQLASVAPAVPATIVGPNGTVIANPAANAAGATAAQAVQPPAPTPAPATPEKPPVAGLANPTGTTSSAGGGANGANGGSASGAAGTNTYFSVNQQAGLINVFATQKQQDKIQTYVDMLMKSVNTQVLIEAKVFEVDLDDDNSLGIDWSAVSKHVSFNSAFGQLPFSDNPLSPINQTTNPGGILTVNSGDVNAVVNAISRFGTVRALSSPRLSVMNNQTAVLNVSKSRVFFKLTVQTTQGTVGVLPQTNVTSEVNNVPEGLIIMVHPSVDPETNEITMNLRPSITRVVDSVNDPAVTIAAANAGIPGLQNPVPELSVREIDSVVKLHSGKTILMGGLMQDRADGTQESIPGLGELPVIGNLFRAHVDNAQKTEMVIMLQATVVGTPEPDAADKEMYQNMGQDRHPFKM
jgi:MSHA biogenesis protein MshL